MGTEDWPQLGDDDSSSQGILSPKPKAGTEIQTSSQRMKKGLIIKPDIGYNIGTPISFLHPFTVPLDVIICDGRQPMAKRKECV